MAGEAEAGERRACQHHRAAGVYGASPVETVTAEGQIVPNPSTRFVGQRPGLASDYSCDTGSDRTRAIARRACSGETITRGTGGQASDRRVDRHGEPHAHGSLFGLVKSDPRLF